MTYTAWYLASSVPAASAPARGIAAVEALHHPHRREEEREDEEGEVMVGAAAEVVVVNEDRRREKEGRPGASRDAGVGGAGGVEEPAYRRGHARQGPEEEEELEVEEHHPAELLVVPRQIQAWNQEGPGVDDAGEVRDVARVVGGKGMSRPARA